MTAHTVPKGENNIIFIEIRTQYMMTADKVDATELASRIVTAFNESVFERDPTERVGLLHAEWVETR